MKDKLYISRKEQSILTKKKIFDITTMLIRKKGYSKVTIREICQNAEISVGTFYLYFLSKDDILLNIYNDLNEKLLEENTLDTTLPLNNQLKQLIDCFFNHLLNTFDKELIREIYRINLSMHSDIIFSSEQPFYKLILGIMKNIQETESLSTDITPESLTQKIFLFIRGHIFQWLMDDDSDFNDMKDDCTNDLFRYLKLYIE